MSVLLVYGDLLAIGLLVTAGTSLAGIALGLLFAAPLAALKLADRAALRWPAATLVEILRNAPFIVLLVLVHFGLGRWIGRVPPWQSGILALGLYGSAYFAEVLRGAYRTVPRGQAEAALALGLTNLQGLVAVVSPQMMRVAAPALRVVAVMLVKDSAVLSIIAVPDLTHAGLRIQAETFETVPVFAAIALLYWLMTSAVGLLAGRWDGRRTAGRTAVRASGVAARYLVLDALPRALPRHPLPLKTIEEDRP